MTICSGNMTISCDSSNKSVEQHVFISEAFYGFHKRETNKCVYEYVGYLAFLSSYLFSKLKLN